MDWDGVRLLIGTLSHTGQGSLLNVARFTGMALHGQLPPKTEFMISQGCYIDRNRNDMIKKALDGVYDKLLGGSFTHFLMFDSDSIPRRRDAVVKLFEADKDIIYAVSACKEAIPFWMVFDWEDRETYTHKWKIIADPWEPYEIFPQYKDKVFEVGGGGTGMVLIKREVLETIEPPWYSTEQTTRVSQTGTYTYVGDDVMFHKRAQDAGFKIYAHGGALCYHQSGKHMFPDFVADVVKASYDFNVYELIGE